LTGSLKFPDTTPPTVTVIEPTFLPSRTASDSLRATWLGHACYYVEFPSGLRVLFDPVFEDRCSPFSFMGPKRYTQPPCHIKDLPIVDLVVISHSHYDHLSHPTVLELHKAHPNATFLVGLGLKKWFHDSGIENVEELDWWQDVDITLSPSTGVKRVSDASSTGPSAKGSDITARISCLPCQHISARSAFDKAHTLWASWAVTSGGKSVWFGGDTGYRAVPELPKEVDDYGDEYAHLPHCPAFKQIGDLRGPFDLGLIPIGAYDPRYIMSPMHANPFDSVNIFVDTKCKRAMGIHWGTWVLTTEDVLEPPQLLKKAMAKKGLPETGVFDVCDIGESREF
jgi:L-ascorbate metabolism protein UlaG (beta-lactamase superfamily)